ncbi:MAG: Rieske (2Fe-2S) protein [Nocardioides sp.]
MSGWTRVCRAEEVPADAAIGETVGEQRLCLARGADGDVVAMLDRCPHRDIALSGGLVRHGLLTCPGHFWRFDLVDAGRRTDDPTYAATVYPSRVDDDGWVWVELPAPRGRCRCASGCWPRPGPRRRGAPPDRQE